MAAGQGNLEGAPGKDLAAHLGQVRNVVGLRFDRRRGGTGLQRDGSRARPDEIDPGRVRPRSSGTPGADRGQRGRQVIDGVDLDPLDELRLRTRFGRHDHPPDAPPGERRNHRQGPRHPAQLAAQ